MGLVYVEGTVTGPTGKKATLEFLVDSGARYTLLPRSVWRKIGLKPRRAMKFLLADGTPIERKLSECRIAFRPSLGQDFTGTTPVVLGEKGDSPLLGVVTLEEWGLMLNPFTRDLEPMRLMLA